MKYGGTETGNDDGVSEKTGTCFGTTEVRASDVTRIYRVLERRRPIWAHSLSHRRNSHVVHHAGAGGRNERCDHVCHSRNILGGKGAR